MDASLAGLIGTAIGAVAGVAGTMVTARHQRHLEGERLRSARMRELLPRLLASEASAASLSDQAFMA